MSREYEGQDPLALAAKAERELNSYQAKTGNSAASDSANESGINEAAASKFPGGSATAGPGATSGGGDKRKILVEEGGSFDDRGRLSKASDFEGEGGPEEKARAFAEENPGSDDVRKDVRTTKGQEHGGA